MVVGDSGTVNSLSTEPPSNTWFLGHTRVQIPNGISVDSAVFTGLTVVINTQTLTLTTLHL